MTPSIQSRIKVFIIHMLWVTLPIAIYWRYSVSPPLRGEEAEALLYCVKIALYQPLLCGVAGLLLCRTRFERWHGHLAFKLSFFYHGVGFVIFVVSILMMYSLILLIPAILVFYVVLPLWMMIGWSMSMVAGILALGGAEKERLAPVLAGRLLQTPTLD